MGLNLRRKPSQDVRNLTRAAKSQIDKTGGKSSPRNAVGSGNCLFSSSSSSPSFIEFSERWLNTVIRDKTGLGSNWSWSTHSFPTRPWNVVPHHRGPTPSTLYEQDWVWVLFVPQEPEQWKSCETAPMIFLPYPRWLKFLTVLPFVVDVTTKAAHSPQLLVRPPWIEPTICSSAPAKKKKRCKAQLKQFLLS